MTLYFMQSGQSHYITSRKDKLTDEDVSLFRTSVKDTTPLRQKNKKIDLPKTTSKTKKTPIRDHNNSDDSLINEFNIETEDSQEVTPPRSEKQAAAKITPWPN